MTTLNIGSVKVAINETAGVHAIGTTKSSLQTVADKKVGTGELVVARPQPHAFASSQAVANS